MTNDVSPLSHKAPALPFNEEGVTDPVALNPLRRITQSHFVVVASFRPGLSPALRSGLESHLKKGESRPAVLSAPTVIMGGPASNKFLLIVEKEAGDDAPAEALQEENMKDLLHEEKRVPQRHNPNGGDYAAILDWMQDYAIDDTKINNLEDVAKKSIVTDMQVLFGQEAWAVARRAGYTIEALDSYQARFKDALDVYKEEVPDNPYTAVIEAVHRIRGGEIDKDDPSVKGLAFLSPFVR